MTKSAKYVSGMMVIFGGIVSSQVLITKFSGFSEYVQKFGRNMLNKSQQIPDVNKNVCGDPLWSKLFNKKKTEDWIEFLFESGEDRIDYQSSWDRCMKNKKKKTH